MTLYIFLVGLALAFVLYVALCAVIMKALVSDCPACGKKALYPVPDIDLEGVYRIIPPVFKCEDCGVFGTYEELGCARAEEKEPANAPATTR